MNLEMYYIFITGENFQHSIATYDEHKQNPKNY